ncbi:MAG: glycosyltransferase [Chitinophagaceae bacterium]|nr:glycosyltransferase [Chitinophagaceae bacterium]
MKKVLIISPHFPPTNAADMQRVRHSLPYFEQFGWTPEVIAVYPQYVEAKTDDLLTATIPEDIKIYKVHAYDTSKTRKFGLGSLSMRAFFQVRKQGDELLKTGGYDLVYFTTTAFHVMALGRYWKKKFGVPFILDIQDPWRNDFYLDKPKEQRPPKFWVSYNIDKYLEMYTMKKVDGVISVSQGYVDMFLQRYPYLKPEQFKVIPFGYSLIDFKVMEEHIHSTKIPIDKSKINIVYVGRGGHDMKLASECFFTALKNVVDKDPAARERLHCLFVGTSYAPDGKGQKTLSPAADKLGIGDMATEISDRVSFFETLYLLKQANAFFVPGSTDKSYTASKIYQYVLAERPMLAIFYKGSSIVSILKEAETGTVVTFDETMQITPGMIARCEAYFRDLLSSKEHVATYNKEAFSAYSAETMTKNQVDFFNKILGA